MYLSYILSDEILLKIFDLCDVYTLSQLRSVCKRFYRISNEVLTKKSDRLLITNEISKKFRERCKPLLSSYNSKFITYYNWKHQIYDKKECQIYTNLTECIRNRMKAKCLKITRNTVWFYDSEDLYAFNRAKDGNIKNKMAHSWLHYPTSNIASCNDMIISGHLDGSIKHWRIESRNYNNALYPVNIHYTCDNHISNIEVTTPHIIYSSSNLIKIMKNILEEDDSAEKKNETLYSGSKLVQSISLDPTGTKFAASAEESFVIYDINRNCQIIDKWIDGDACTQLLWQDSDTILMLYKRQIKKMDIRTLKFVRTWNASFQYRYQALYCFSSDNLYTIMTGTNVGTVILWDQRLNNFIQMYKFPDHPGIFTNFVLSVQFDSTHMYAFTRTQGLTEFDFKGGNIDRAKRKEYFCNFV